MRFLALQIKAVHSIENYLIDSDPMCWVEQLLFKYFQLFLLSVLFKVVPSCCGLKTLIFITSQEKFGGQNVSVWEILRWCRENVSNMCYDFPT